MSEKSRVHIELGCGNNRRDMDGYENIGVDIMRSNCTDLIINLGFENLPFGDKSVDIVQAYDVLEHIPKCIWKPDINSYNIPPVAGADKSTIITNPMRMIRENPLINLMNEIFRVLRDGGRFVAEMPFSNEAYDRDPTHVTKLSEDWFHYFKKDDNLYYDQGLVKCDFKLDTNRFREYKWTKKDIMHTELIAVKSRGKEPSPAYKMLNTTSNDGLPIVIPEDVANEGEKNRASSSYERDSALITRQPLI